MKKKVEPLPLSDSTQILPPVHTAKAGLGAAGFMIILMGLAAAFVGMAASVSFPNIEPEAAMPALAATLAPGLRGLIDIAMLGGSAIAVVIFQIVAATLLVRGIWLRSLASQLPRQLPGQEFLGWPAHAILEWSSICHSGC